MDAFQRLEDRLSRNTKGGRAPVAVTEEQVAAAEAKLGVKFPPSYRKLVLTFNPGVMPGDVYWVDGDGTLEDWLDIVQNNKPGWHPSFLLAVVAHGNGDESCFDLRHRDEHGEYPIVFYDHEIHGPDDTEFRVEANNLAEFLLGDTP